MKKKTTHIRHVGTNHRVLMQNFIMNNDMI